MKTLTLIRHAKSSRKNPGLADYDRPLNKRGRRDAPMMGRRLAERGFDAGLMMTSPAARAVATAEAIAEEIEYPLKEIVPNERLYGADQFELLEVIRGIDDSLDEVVLVGHNPGLTDLVNYLSSHPIGNVPTCGIVELVLDVDSWALIDRTRPTNVDFDYPRKLG